MSMATPLARSLPKPATIESVTQSQVLPPGNHGQPPSPLRRFCSRAKAACISFSARVASNRRAILARASPSLTASRTHGVSASSVLIRSVFLSSGLSSASVPFHCAKIWAIFGSRVAMCRARLLAYKRVNSVSVLSSLCSMIDGNANTAYQAGLEAAWITSDWF